MRKTSRLTKVKVFVTQITFWSNGPKFGLAFIVDVGNATRGTYMVPQSSVQKWLSSTVASPSKPQHLVVSADRRPVAEE
jgi:hypothetical protein